MAEFRRMLYAFALVALLAGLTVPASAQECHGTANNPLIRAEDYTALAGDIFVTCSGGTPTSNGSLVPKINITVSSSTTTITSKLTDTDVSPNFNEALLIMDEAGETSTGAPPLLNCGNADAPYGTTPFVCDVTGTGTGAGVYNGSEGRPNVFQARQVNNSGGTAIQFIGVPLDARGTDGFVVGSRKFRITNLRVNAVALGVSGSGAFTNASINTLVNFNATNFGGSQFINVVNGTVRPGLIAKSDSNDEPANFLQCNATSGNAENDIVIEEGFPTAFRVRNWRQIEDNGNPPSSGSWTYNGGTTWNGDDVVQNVPNALYNTESGLMYPGGVDFPDGPNPPPGTATGEGDAPEGTPFADNAESGQGAGHGGIDLAGTVTQGTRIAVRIGTVPKGSNPSIPNVVFLTSNDINTGVMVLVSGADSHGAGGSPDSVTDEDSTEVEAGDVVVYEVIFSNPDALETARITVTVDPDVDLSASPSTPEVGVDATASVSFAPFYAAGSGANFAALMASKAGTKPTRFPVVRFIDTAQGPFTLFSFNKCACDLLFPWVVGDGTFTTSIVIANTSKDPDNGDSDHTHGFSAIPQSGKVTFWYYGTTGISLDPTTPISTQASQTSTVSVPAGSYLAHIVSPGAAGTTAANGLVKLSANFAGYVIAQAQFQYCHGVASIGANQPGFGTQTYIGLTLDNGRSKLPRTTQSANDGLRH